MSRLLVEGDKVLTEVNTKIYKLYLQLAGNNEIRRVTTSQARRHPYTNLRSLLLLIEIMSQFRNANVSKKSLLEEAFNCFQMSVAADSSS